MTKKRLPLFAIMFLLLAQGSRAAITHAAPNGARLAGERRSPRQSTPPSESFDLQGYATELESLSASARRLRKHPEEAAALRKRLPDAWSVTIQKQRFLISNQPLGAALDRLIADPRTAAAAAPEMSLRVESLLDEARAISRAPIRNYDGTRAKLHDILKRREFRFVRQPIESETFWDQLMDRLLQWISRLLSRAHGHPTAANFLRWGIVIVLSLICLAWLIYTLIHTSYRRFPAPKGATPEAPWRDWAQEARAAAARGEFREAIRMIYGAALLLMGEAGVWQVDPSRTHREYVRLLPLDSAQRPHLIAITVCFEQVWYGRAKPSARDYEAALAELESLA